MVVQRYDQSLQGLELVYPLLGVAHADLAEGLVLVPAGTHVLHVQDVILSLLGVIPCVGQFGAQGLWQNSTKVIYK